jgi:YggT family protein
VTAVRPHRSGCQIKDLMFLFAELISGIASLLDIYIYIIIGRAICSWVNADPYNPIVRFLYKATEPLLYRVRRILPDMGGLDLSPMVIILAIYFIKRVLYQIAFRM